RHTRFSRDWSSDVCSSDLTSPSQSYMLFNVLLIAEPSASGGITPRSSNICIITPSTSLLMVMSLGWYILSAGAILYRLMADISGLLSSLITSPQDFLRAGIYFLANLRTSLVVLISGFLKMVDWKSRGRLATA